MAAKVPGCKTVFVLDWRVDMWAEHFGDNLTDFGITIYAFSLEILFSRKNSTFFSFELKFLRVHADF